ncbi:MAG: hypothetical protein ACMG6E_07800, partial [Candidatus Roizmanbacteria bacterium]
CNKKIISYEESDYAKQIYAVFNKEASDGYALIQGDLRSHRYGRPRWCGACNAAMNDHNGVPSKTRY